MRFFAKIFGSRHVGTFASGRGWIVSVVGEKKFQDNLLAQHYSHRKGEHDAKAVAILVPEANNTHDPNAVRVEIGRMPVGYLTREMAADYRTAIGSESGQCSAKIVGGFLLDDGTRAYFGVKLNISWPPRFMS